MITSRKSPAAPTEGFGVDVYGTGPYRWEAWDGMTKLATGTARTRVGLWIAAHRAKRRHLAT